MCLHSERWAAEKAAGAKQGVCGHERNVGWKKRIASFINFTKRRMNHTYFKDVALPGEGVKSGQ